jgi:hypothetical protein
VVPSQHRQGHARGPYEIVARSAKIKKRMIVSPSNKRLLLNMSTQSTFFEPILPLIYIGIYILVRILLHSGKTSNANCCWLKKNHNPGQLCPEEDNKRSLLVFSILYMGIPFTGSILAILLHIFPSLTKDQTLVIGSFLLMLSEFILEKYVFECNFNL